jgi:Ca2+-binding EF-hand superfamily protein
MAFKSKQIKRRASLSNLEVQLEGILEKRSTGLRKIWQKRYFVLESQFLKYYDGEAKKSMKGAMDLNHLVKIRVNPTGQSKGGEEITEIALELEAPKDEDDSPGAGARICYLLRASSADEAEKWKELMSKFLHDPEPEQKPKKTGMMRRFSFKGKKKKEQDVQDEQEECQQDDGGDKGGENQDEKKAGAGEAETASETIAQKGDDDGDVDGDSEDKEGTKRDVGEGGAEGGEEREGDGNSDEECDQSGKSPELMQALELEEARCAATFASAIDPQKESVKGRLYVVFKLENFFKLPEGCGEPSLTMILGDVNPPLNATLNSSILKMPVDDYSRSVILEVKDGRNHLLGSSKIPLSCLKAGPLKRYKVKVYSQSGAVAAEVQMAIGVAAWDSVRFEVYDYDMLTSDTFLGSLTVDGIDLLHCDGNKDETWFPLQPLRGKKSKHVAGNISFSISIGEKSNQLNVQLQGANNLAKADIFGDSDPYCKIFWNNEQIAKTIVVDNCLTPCWDKEVDLLATELIALQKHVSQSRVELEEKWIKEHGEHDGGDDGEGDEDDEEEKKEKEKAKVVFSKLKSFEEQLRAMEEAVGTFETALKAPEKQAGRTQIEQELAQLHGQLEKLHFQGIDGISVRELREYPGEEEGDAATGPRPEALAVRRALVTRADALNERITSAKKMAPTEEAMEVHTARQEAERKKQLEDIEEAKKQEEEQAKEREEMAKTMGPSQLLKIKSLARKMKRNTVASLAKKRAAEAAEKEAEAKVANERQEGEAAANETALEAANPSALNDAGHLDPWQVLQGKVKAREISLGANKALGGGDSSTGGGWATTLDALQFAEEGTAGAEKLQADAEKLRAEMSAAAEEEMEEAEAQGGAAEEFKEDPALRAVFTHYDYDGDGEVTVDEMTKYMLSLLQKRHGQDLTETLIKQAEASAAKMFFMFDKDDSASISFREFQQWHVERKAALQATMVNNKKAQEEQGEDEQEEQGEDESELEIEAQESDEERRRKQAMASIQKKQKEVEVAHRQKDEKELTRLQDERRNMEKLSAEDQALKAVFDHYDADGSGEVTREEMLDYMTQLLEKKSAGKVGQEEITKRAKVAADK